MRKNMQGNLTEEELFQKIRTALKNGHSQEVLNSSLLLVEHFPTHSNILIAAKNLQSILPSIQVHYHNKDKVKLALLYSSTATWIKDYLMVNLVAENLFPSIYSAPYQQVEQEILNPESELYRFKPEMIFLHLELTCLLPLGFEYEKSQIEKIITRIRSLVSFMQSHTKSMIVIDNFPQPGYLPIRSPMDLKFSSVKEWFYLLNKALADQFQEESSVFICDLDHLTFLHGKEHATNAKLFYLAHLEMSESFLPLVCKKYAGYVKALKGKGRKCLVLDLDNTLWGGIIGEDGVEGIRLSPKGEGREFYEFQKLLYHFMQRGVLLAINSRNNWTDVGKVFETHPSMLLKKEYFSSIKVNWDNKISNMEKIARELNISLDSIVFWDDDPRERAMMRQALPQVLVPEVPKDPSDYCRFLIQMNDFEPIHFTEEDARRTQLYQMQKQGEQFKQNFQSLEEYLWNLEIAAKISEVTEKDIPRIAQLMQRTNQFNMTSRRYSPSELKQMLSSGDYRLFSIQVGDRFGDSGTIGSAVLEKQGNSYLLRAFLLSCRILGRGIEDFFMNYLYEVAKQEGMEQLVGELFFTEKNQPARDFYKKYGFTLVSQNEEGSQWRYPLKENEPKTIPWINAKQYVRS